MQLFTILLFILPAITIAQQKSPVPQKGAGGCTFSSAESLHLGHGHDLNSGKVKLGDKILQVPKANTGCSAEWAAEDDK
jgi:hypothetical protein